MSATGVLLVAVLVDRWLNPASWAFSSYALAAFVLLSLVRWLRGHSTVVPMDDETLALLDSAPEVDADCAAIVEALVSAPVTDDIAECAEQMRSIVVGNHMSYRTLADNPGALLAASRHFANSTHGALLTRFTVQYNLYAGSIVALGSDEQREQLYDTQAAGELGCFAFTESGAGVLSGAGCETTAVYDATRDAFVINSPTTSSRKNWISQGLCAERAVILAEVIISGRSYGPHLFWARIANRTTTRGSSTLRHLPGVEVASLPDKIALHGLDNAYIDFTDFVVDRSALLTRFVSVSADGTHAFNLPTGVKRMLDLLISRLLTGRICLSDFNIAHGLMLARRSWEYVNNRELWRGRKPQGKLMSAMPLIQTAFSDYSRTLAVVGHFITTTRGEVAECIAADCFPNDVVERTCVCKFVGTAFGVDSVSVLRKVMGSHAVLAKSGLGANTFVCNATCAAEGDNTVMELKVVGDMVRGRTSMLPGGLLARSLTSAHSRKALWAFVKGIARARMLGKKALGEGQLLKDIAWARAHLLILDAWRRQTDFPPSWVDSYARVMIRFPTPICF